MRITSQLIRTTMCGLVNGTNYRTTHLVLFSSKPPESKPGESSNSSAGEKPKSDHIKKISEQSLKVAEAWKKLYSEKFKVGNEWYQDKLKAIWQSKNGLKADEWYSAKVGFWMKRYENFVGLTEVKAAQHRVVDTERQFILAQDERRETQLAINDVQAKIKALHAELEKTHRGEDRYLTLITQEHLILKDERTLTERLLALEKAERNRFAELSNAVRDSHEKERAQAEKTKYWSVIGSVVGTCLGILGTTINNRLRMKELRQIVRDASAAAAVAGGGVALASSGSTPLAQGTDQSLEKLQLLLEKQQQDIKQIVDKVISGNSWEKMSSDVGRLVASLSEAVKSIQGASQARIASPTSIVTTKELNAFFDQQQKSLEYHFSDLKKSLLGQNASAHDLLAKETFRRKEESEKKLLESLNRTNAASYQAFHTRACDIDEKVKDIRSLILAQVNAAVVFPPTSNADSDLARSHRTIVGTVESALREHEERVRTSVVLAGIFTAILTPIVLLAIGKLS